MTTGLVTHPACIDHVTPPGHPERVERLQAVLEALDESSLPGLARMTAPRAAREALLRTHTAELVDRILLAEVARGQFARLDADTAMSPGSAEAALCAAGAVAGAVDAVMSGRIGNAFCAVRPPGHHAERARSMGFCLFNNIAVGALHARAIYGLQRVAVVDFDVHHGNGTQDIFYGDADLFYASTHQFPLYPGTGSSAERGIAGNIINAPLAPGAGSAEFRSAFDDLILPALETFSPQFVFISAGFDAHKSDPLASLRLVESDFAWATEQICAVAGRVCGGRVVSALEGGYDLDALARSAAAHVKAMIAGSES
ncbi:MAG TPA: histone deacetylase family protein [Rhizomicrobium sp.]|jgi:acetoin utilization deacetylase AcuC-like enzyme|nr:histone deacetylase family protein [Rhizomicrobium sp.]